MKNIVTRKELTSKEELLEIIEELDKIEDKIRGHLKNNGINPYVHLEDRYIDDERTDEDTRKRLTELTPDELQMVEIYQYIKHEISSLNLPLYYHLKPITHIGPITRSKNGEYSIDGVAMEQYSLFEICDNESFSKQNIWKTARFIPSQGGRFCYETESYPDYKPIKEGMIARIRY